MCTYPMIIIYPQAVLITRKKAPAKHENVVLPALSRRRKCFDQKNLPPVPEIENTAKVLPAIEPKSTCPSFYSTIYDNCRYNLLS